MQVLLNSAIFLAVVTAALGLLSHFIKQRGEEASTNLAILAEAKRLRALIEVHRGYWQTWMNQGVAHQYPLIPFSHVVYDKQVKNVGIIKGHLVERIVGFYGYIDFLNGLQAARAWYDTNGLTKNFNDTYLKSLTNFLENPGNSF
jgi:hypothetical protein